MIPPIKTNPDRYKLETAARVVMRTPAAQLINGIFPETGLAVIFGYSGDGKSFLAQDAFGAVSQGRTHWCGYRISKSAPVTWLALEGAGGMPQRLQAYESEHGELPANFRIFSGSIDICEPQDLADFIDVCGRTGQTDGVVVIDTLAQSCPGLEENNSADISMVISAGKAIQAALGGLVVFVHHRGKDKTRGLRGHSSLHAAMDAIIEVRREGNNRSWHVVKSKDGSDEASGNFRLRVVNLYENEWGDQVSSCVIEQEEGAHATSTKDMAALEVLKSIYRTATPSMASWREACISNGLITAASPSAAEKSMDRIRKSLQAGGLIIPGTTRGVYLPLGGVADD